ncbi:nucleotidyltransferase family protein [Natronospora cellulosivora (SeqCode)]
MKAIILAAGYATRLYPLTKDRPKPLLEVGGKSILEYILEKLRKVREVDQVYIVTNEKFYTHFTDWTSNYEYPVDIKVINDHTTTNEDRLGGIGDLYYVIEQEELNDNLLVMAGDNLFSFELTDFVDFHIELNADCITSFILDDQEEIKRMGVVEADTSNKVLSFEEKPERPKSNLAVPAFYIYKKTTIPLIKQYLDEGNNPDAPGNFVPWLITKKDVYTFKFDGYWYDIGTKESYEEVQSIF